MGVTIRGHLYSKDNLLYFKSLTLQLGFLAPIIVQPFLPASESEELPDSCQMPGLNISDMPGEY